MIKKTKKQPNKIDLIKKNIFTIFPSLIIFFIPFIFSRYPYTKISDELIEETYRKYTSKKVQEEGYSVYGKTFSRKDRAVLKLKLLSKINKSQKDFIIISNHQFQYITEKLGALPIFNIWMNDSGITEIADFVAYMDEVDDSLLPNKILITQITSPNNDMGGSIVGYRDELPDFIVGQSKNPFVIKKSALIFSPGTIFSTSAPIRKLRQQFDFKNLWGFIKTELLKNSSRGDISIIKSLDLPGEFAFDKTGSSIGRKTRILKLNESHINFNGEVRLAYSDCNEIVYSLQHIDKVAHRRGILHIVVIPPVYETSDPKYLYSFVNLVVDKCLEDFYKTAKSTLIIDHRREKKFLDVKSKNFYEDFDHPSSLYGIELFKEIEEISNNYF